MSFFWRGLEYREDPTGGPEESISIDAGQSAISLHWEDWTQREEYYKQFLGYTAMLTHADTGKRYLNRVTPFYHRGYAGDSALWAQSATLTGDGAAASFDGNDLASFSKARVKLTLADRPYRILTDAEMTSQQLAENWTIVAYPDEATMWRYISVEKTPRSKFQTIPSMKAFQINTTGTPIVNTFAVLLAENNVAITWHQIPIRAIPYRAIESCLGKCNDKLIGAQAGSLTMLGGPINPGRLVLQTYSLRKMYRMPNGEFGTDITYNFVDYVSGANVFYVVPPLPHSPGFYEVSRDGASRVDSVTGAVVGNNDALPFPVPSVGSMLDLFRPSAV